MMTQHPQNGSLVPISLEARVQVINDLPPDDIEALAEYMRVVTNYGVAETADVKCRECGVQTSMAIHIDASTFLPSLQR
jgi:hypothetical protein